MSRQKRPSDMQRIATAFHFTKQDLMLNRQRKLSEAQRKRMWRRYWTGLTLMIVIFGLGSVFLALFLWGTAPEGTFAFLPPNTAVGAGGDNEQLFFFGQIFTVLFMLVMIVVCFNMIVMAVNLRHGEVHVYQGVIQIRMGYDDNSLRLKDEGRSFDISDQQYSVLEPFVDQRHFAVYYVLTREGIISLEPI